MRQKQYEDVADGSGVSTVNWSYCGLMASPKHLIAKQAKSHKKKVNEANKIVFKQTSNTPAIMSNVSLQRVRGAPVPEAEQAIVAHTAEVTRLIDVTSNTARLSENRR